ncbi:hypothetical protein [uncultured Roseobacter sp.]|uniref:hypothetical protein n=1 Tax=uncultured Roseobacter sp. TaxID=114847 RepID=UPI00262C7400|nr:hypothetical protein [uncultured Roseobacter sp.]
MGNALCTATGAAATSVTAPGARPCLPGGDGCVGAVTVHGSVTQYNPRGDCAYATITVRFAGPSGRDDASGSMISRYGDRSSGAGAALGGQE